MAAFVRNALTRNGAEIALAAVVVLIVGMMIVPLPTWLLDVLIAANLSISLLLLLTALFVRRPLSFGAFPTILLVTTLFRLGLNVSSTRLILLQADAGTVIAAFGEFVVRGNYVVGAVIFVLLTVIQLVVIARGAERVAEVGARFTLDAMPGKQLAIDADLRAGTLDAEGASGRRRELERESQFYGAMDGAMKFVKGDAIAAIVITVVNILGGLAVGVVQNDLGVEPALRLYGLLTIGDGLVSQIPALLISTAAALVVTRVVSERERGTLGADIGAQIFGDWRALGAGATFAGLLSVVPGLPLVPFAVLATLLGTLSIWLYRQRPAPTPHESGGEPPRSSPLELRVGPILARAIAEDAGFGERIEEAGALLYDHLGVRLPASRPSSTRTPTPSGSARSRSIEAAARPTDASSSGRPPCSRPAIRRPTWTVKEAGYGAATGAPRRRSWSIASPSPRGSTRSRCSVCRRRSASSTGSRERPRRSSARSSRSG